MRNKQGFHAVGTDRFESPGWIRKWRVQKTVQWQRCWLQTNGLIISTIKRNIITGISFCHFFCLTIINLCSKITLFFTFANFFMALNKLFANLISARLLCIESKQCALYRQAQRRSMAAGAPATVRSCKRALSIAVCSSGMQQKEPCGCKVI